ncbi:MAG: hypothetical protein NC318_12445 [Blautia sp.]|nr:hypothetical protein [Blautia sp.]
MERGLSICYGGGIHGFYQIMGDCLGNLKEKLYAYLKISPDSKGKKLCRQAGTFLLVNFAWVIFRADSAETGLRMIKHMFTECNPWIFFNDRIFTLGLGWKEMAVLFLAIILLFVVERKQEEGVSFSMRIMRQKLPVRWLVCMAGICATMVFGTYGFGFDVQDFIYGGF